jgi:chromosomal replication initiation ATPase DnaA
VSCPERPVINGPLLLLECARLFDTTAKDLRGNSRFRLHTHPRFALFKVMHLRGASKHQIGRFFERDHSTVVHGIRQADALAVRDIDYGARLSALAQYGETL